MKVSKKDQKIRSTNARESQPISDLKSPAISPHTQQPFKKRASKRKKPKTVFREARKPQDSKPKLDKDDQELVRALDRIHANHDLTRALLFMVAQALPEARRMVLNSYVITANDNR